MGVRGIKKQQATLFSEIVVDNFAGGGGASTGIQLAIGRSVDVAINHDPAAIATLKQETTAAQTSLQKANEELIRYNIFRKNK